MHNFSIVFFAKKEKKEQKKELKKNESLISL